VHCRARRGSPAVSAPLRRRYVDGRHGQVHLRVAQPEASTGHRPLVCFHLSPVSGVVYERFLAEMGRDRLAVAPDTPGYGASDPPAVPPTIADYAQAMGDVLDALAIRECDIVGYHTGSKIAVALAIARPAAVRHLVLIGAPVYTHEELARMRAHLARNFEPTEDGAHLVDYWRAVLNWRGPGQTLGMIMQGFPDALRGAERRAWGHRAAFEWSHADHLPQVDQPVLVLNPRDDLWEYTPRAVACLKHGRVVNLPDWGHGFLDLHTAEVGRLVRRFVDHAELPEAGPA